MSTADEFFEVLEKSNLLTSEQLADARRSVQDVDDPTTIARTLVSKELLTRWQAGQLLAGRGSFFLGKYKLIDLLGRGGMGSVFLGEHTMMNRRVALKILSKQVSKDPDSLQWFLSEARAIAALDHPNMVQAYSVDTEGDRYYIVMEYIDGRNLQQVVEEDGLPDYETAADYIRQAADGLAHGHGREMIHCDIKPSNLLVNDQGVVKIVDMGLTRLTGRDDEGLDGQDERILGSVDYMSPEQALKGPDFDHRADIYSLGCTLYFLLTGHPPFPGGPLHERLMKHQTQEPQSIIEQRLDAPTPLVRLCQTMMAKKPEDRPQSVEEVSRILSEWQPPPRRPKHLVPPKRAAAVEEPAEQRLPSIDVDVKPKPAAAAAKGDRPSEKPGLLSTRRQRVVAGVIAAAAATVVLLAATIPFLVNSESDTDKDRRSRARSSVKDADGRDSTDGESTPAGELPSDGSPTGQPPAEKAPSEEPPAEQPPAEGPASDAPPREEPSGHEPEPDRQPEPDKPEPDETQPDKPPDEPTPDEPQPDEPEPEEPEPDEQPPAKPEKKDPFRALAAAVDLPAVKARAGPDEQPPGPIALGELQLAPDAYVGLELLGGEGALRGRRSFAMDPIEPDQPGAQERSWRVRLVESGSGGTDTTDVAKVWLDQQTLRFEWLGKTGQPTADQLRNCGYLGNCGLSINVDGQTRWLPLSRPTELEPLKVDLERGSKRALLPAERLPDLSTLHLQVTGLEGPFPQHEFQPDDTIAAKGKTDISFPGDKLPNFWLRVSFDVKGRTATIAVSALCKLPNGSESPFNAKVARAMAANALAAKQRLQQMIARYQKDQRQKKALEEQLRTVEAGLERLEEFGTTCQAINQDGKVHFRVFRTVGDEQIDLFATRLAGAKADDTVAQ